MRAVRTAAPAVVLAVLLSLTGCDRGQPQASPAPAPTTTLPVVTTPATPAPVTATPRPTHPPTATPTRPEPEPTTAPPFPRALLGKDVERIPTGRAVVALTFDAGANADGLPSILATLAREHVLATFFLTGDFATMYPSQARQIAAGGYRLGNHSVNHPHFPDLTDARMRAEVLDAARQIRAATGADPAPLFRFPYGDRTARTIAVLNGLGYLPVRWTVDSLGWQGTKSGTRGPSFVADRVLAAAGPGAIVVMHVGSNPDDHSTLDAAALPAIIAGLRARGYSFVTLNALLT